MVVTVSDQLRRVIRWLVYRTRTDRVLGRLLPARSSTRDASYWDRQLRGEFSTYLTNKLSLATRDVICAALAYHYRPNCERVIDIGCGPGRLGIAFAGHGLKRYTGVDISEVATTKAASLWADAGSTLSACAKFVTSDLSSFHVGTEERPDIVVFNELLYLLDLDVAMEEVARIMAESGPGAALLVTMKNDAKSSVIFDALQRRYRWIDGILFQRQPHGPAFRVLYDRAAAACVAGLFEQIARPGAQRSE